VISDRQRLGEELVRLHVVAASDEKWDQELKLRVRDAVSESLRSDLEKIRDAGEAKRYLQEKLPYIREVAQSTLRVFGCQDTVSVSLCREVFDRRVYDTFSLPAGVYDALRIVIGEGQGKNWWCVVFPGLCIPAASEGTAAVAAGAGFPEGLNNTLIGQEGYELRFGILDAMGKLENLFFGE
jgi:stage II sporulation protein R